MYSYGEIGRDSFIDDTPEAEETPVTVRVSLTIELDVPYHRFDDETDAEVIRAFEKEHHQLLWNPTGAAIAKYLVDGTDYEILEVVDE
jgi:hypothetical protein